MLIGILRLVIMAKCSICISHVTEIDAAMVLDGAWSSNYRHGSHFVRRRFGELSVIGWIEAPFHVKQNWKETSKLSAFKASFRKLLLKARRACDLDILGTGIGQCAGHRSILHPELAAP